MARENARVHGAGEVAAACADVQILELLRSLAVFVDPARRAGAAPLAGGESHPPLAWCLELAGRVAAVGISRSRPAPQPGPPGWEVELPADRRELKEVLWSPALATTGRRATPSSQARPPWPPSPDPPGQRLCPAARRAPTCSTPARP